MGAEHFTNWGGKIWEGQVDWPASASGKVYDLAVRLELGMTHHAAHPPFSYALVKTHRDHSYPNGISTTMEMISMGAHVGTHVDAPGHIAFDGCVFGGAEILDQQLPYEGLKIGSVEGLAPLFGPGRI